MSAFNDHTDQDWHVVPMGDLRPHKSARDCWCGPTQNADEPSVWVHHSLDGRENTKEQGKLQ